MKSRVWLLALLIIALTASLGWTGGETEKEVKQTSLLLNWKILGDHAPYFVALKKGWYAEEGLEVDIMLGKGSGFSVQSVDTEKADFAIADTAVAVSGRTKGASVMKRNRSRRLAKSYTLSSPHPPSLRPGSSPGRNEGGW